MALILGFAILLGGTTIQGHILWLILSPTHKKFGEKKSSESCRKAIVSAVMKSTSF